MTEERTVSTVIVEYNDGERNTHSLDADTSDEDRWALAQALTQALYEALHDATQYTIIPGGWPAMEAVYALQDETTTQLDYCRGGA